MWEIFLPNAPPKWSPIQSQCEHCLSPTTIWATKRTPHCQNTIHLDRKMVFGSSIYYWQLVGRNTHPSVVLPSLSSWPVVKLVALGMCLIGRTSHAHNAILLSDIGDEPLLAPLFRVFSVTVTHDEVHHRVGCLPSDPQHVVLLHKAHHLHHRCLIIGSAPASPTSLCLHKAQEITAARTGADNSSSSSSLDCQFSAITTAAKLSPASARSASSVCKDEANSGLSAFTFYTSL